MVNLANETDTELIIPRRQELYHGLRMRIANLNADLEDSQWTRIEIKQTEPAAVYDEIHKRVRVLFKAAAAGNLPGGDNTHARQSLSRGSADLGVAGKDEELLQLLIDYHGLGRADIQGGDSNWIADGRLTEDGKAAVRVLEQSGVFLRLESPGVDLIEDVLSVASKPFIITGDYEIPEKLVDRLNSRGVRFGVNCDPADVAGFVDRLESLKSRLRERTHLFLYLTSTDGLDQAKRSLYLRLIDKGWTHNEIYGNRQHRGLVGGGNLGSIGK